MTDVARRVMYTTHRHLLKEEHITQGRKLFVHTHTSDAFEFAIMVSRSTNFHEEALEEAKV